MKMGLIVQKFGGTSVADTERLRNVARIITDTYKAGNQVVVVLSAQGDTTDDLIEKAGAEKGKKPRISLNWPQAVIRCGYVDAEIAGSSAAEEVQMEEANEGEMHSD